MKKKLTLFNLLSFTYELQGNDIFKKAENDLINLVDYKIYKRENHTKNNNSWNKKSENLKIECLIESKNEKTKKVKNYTVTFLFEDITKGVNSPIKFRTGGLNQYDPKNTENVQFDFFMKLEYVLAEFNLLYGQSRANRPAEKKNPNNYIYLDKTSLWVVNNVLLPLISKLK